MDSVKKFSPALFVLIIFCFVLPFVNLSCGGQTIVSLTGFQLMTGADIDASNMFDGLSNGNVDMGTEENKKVDAQPFAFLAFAMALVGLVLGFIKVKAIAITNVIISALGFIFLILLKINLDGDAELSGQNIITLDYQIGYWGAVLLFLGGAVLYFLIFREPAYVKNPPDISSSMP